MYRYTTLIPAPGDTPPISLLSGHTAIPVLDLQPDQRGMTVIQFQTEDYDHAIEWLTSLAAAADELAEKIRDRQRQTEQLLAAVEATPVPFETPTFVEKQTWTESTS